LLADRPAHSGGVAVVCDDPSPTSLCRTLAAARAIRAAGGPAVVGIRRGAEFTNRFRWVLRVRPESNDMLVLTDADTREQSACSLDEAIQRILT